MHKYILINTIFVYLSIPIPAHATDFHLTTQYYLQIKDTSQPDSLKNVVKFTRSWELPSSLQKISGIDYLDDSHIACIQDEVGAIYIYNLETKIIENEIPFGPPGDYQGVTIVDDNAYVASADGRIFELQNYRSGKPVVKEYGTDLSVKQSVEGLCYDRKSNTLLIVIKAEAEANRYYKGIYSFNLTTKVMPVKPAFKINLRNPLFKKLQPKKLQLVFQPSDISIHPVTGELFIIDGTRLQLLVMKGSETIDLITLDKTIFIQPEGITFTPSGELFIACKGMKDEPGILIQAHFK